MGIRINLTSVFVDDQAKALEFYTDKLGFVANTDVPVGEYRWLIVVSADEPDGTELLLEPDQHPATKAYTAAFSPNAIGLTGTMKQIDALTRRYRVAFSYGKPDAQGNYVVDHSAGVYIFGPSGRIRLLASDTNAPSAWVHDLKQLIADEA